MTKLDRMYKISKEILIIFFILSLSFFVLYNPYVRPADNMTYGYWTITKREHRLLLGLTGHTFIEMRDETGKVIKQMHGLATDENNNYKTVGNSSTDKLKVWEFDFDLYKEVRGVDIGNTTVTLLRTDKVEVNKFWNKAKNCSEAINNKNIPYPEFGFSLFSETENSNSVADSLIFCMGLQNQNIGLITPGRNNNLLMD